jgi:hypothetical protein
LQECGNTTNPRIERQKHADTCEADFPTSALQLKHEDLMDLLLKIFKENLY